MQPSSMWNSALPWPHVADSLGSWLRTRDAPLCRSGPNGRLRCGREARPESLILRPSPPYRLTYHHARTQVEYEVVNPGLLTYQVSAHLGRVSFERDADDVLELRWRVCIQPLEGWEAVVRPLTELSLVTAARSFQAHRPAASNRVGFFRLPDPNVERTINWGQPSGFRSSWLEEKKETEPSGEGGRE